VAPALINSISLQIPNEVAWQTLPPEAKVSVSFTVDTAGKPKDIQITKSLNAFWDARVIEALQKSQYRPATVSKSPVPMNVDLTVKIDR
jgi:TonB family protein